MFQTRNQNTISITVIYRLILITKVVGTDEVLMTRHW